VPSGWSTGKSPSLPHRCGRQHRPHGAGRAAHPQERKLVDVPVTVANKPGGSGTIGLNYLNQHAGDGHYLIIATTGSISNHIMGLIPYNHNDFTALAMLFDEYLGVTVKVDSPLKSGRELAERLRKDPEALSIGISTSVGGANHTALMVCLRAAGINIRRLKTVVFPGGAASTTALLGGHVDAINTAPGSIVEHIKRAAARLRFHRRNAWAACLPPCRPGASRVSMRIREAGAA
jgi:putative tricarboxylic transport membrane protein